MVGAVQIVPLCGQFLGHQCWPLGCFDVATNCWDGCLPTMPQTAAQLPFTSGGAPRGGLPLPAAGQTHPHTQG